MTAVVLHLSDIHIKTAADPILHRGADIAKTVFSSLPSASHVFIVVSGDVAFSGESSQYESATKLFTAIRETIQKEAACPVSFILIPGNHDCDFSKNSAARKMLVDNIDKQDSPDVDDSVIKICTSVQNDFFGFRDALENCTDVKDDLLWRTSRFKVEGKTLEFECLNIAWVSKLREEPGRLYFPISRYSEHSLDDADIRFAVLHHPLNWFSQSIYRPFRCFIRKVSDIVITGHEHQGNVGFIIDTETDSSTFVEGCVLQSEKRDLTDSSFNLIVLDLGLGQFASTRYKWDGQRYAADEEGSWSDYHDLPAKRSNPFSIEQEFQETLEDPGAFFKHPSRTNIGLSDIYVYPDLRKVGNGEDRRRTFVSSSRLLSPEVTADGVLIEGEEKSGCTSLLYQLYRQYHDRGFVPLLVNGKDLKKVTDPDIDNLRKP